MIRVACITAALCWWTAAAQAQTDPLAASRVAFRDGAYDVALDRLDDVRPDALSDAERLERAELRALSLYMLERRDEAAAAWQEVLRIDPTFRLDPVTYSPIFVAFFNALPVPEPVAPPGPDAVKHAAAEAAAEPATSEQQPAVDASEPPELAPAVAKPVSSDDGPVGCSVVVCLIPFGAGQFANGSVGKGLVFLSIEVAFLVANIALAIEREVSFANDPYGFDPQVEDTKAALQNAALGGFVITAVAGIIEAFVFR